MFKIRYNEYGKRSSLIMSFVKDDTSDENLLNTLVTELHTNPYARRMAYDQWWWSNEGEMNRFITYWTLKYASKNGST